MLRDLKLIASSGDNIRASSYLVMRKRSSSLYFNIGNMIIMKCLHKQNSYSYIISIISINNELNPFQLVQWHRSCNDLNCLLFCCCFFLVLQKVITPQGWMECNALLLSKCFECLMFSMLIVITFSHYYDRY